MKPFVIVRLAGIPAAVTALALTASCGEAPPTENSDDGAIAAYEEWRADVSAGRVSEACTSMSARHVQIGIEVFSRRDLIPADVTEPDCGTLLGPLAEAYSEPELAAQVASEDIYIRDGSPTLVTTEVDDLVTGVYPMEYRDGSWVFVQGRGQYADLIWNSFVNRIEIAAGNRG